jgi:hypothetical protein
MKGYPFARAVLLGTVFLLLAAAQAAAHTTRSAGTSRWYSATSAFNTPIPPNPPIHPDSGEMVKLWEPDPGNPSSSYWLGPRGGPGLSATPAVGYPKRSTPDVTVQINFPTCGHHAVKAPLPEATGVSGPPNENKLTLMLPNGTEWDFFDITPPGQAPYNLSPEGGPSSCAPTGMWQAAAAVLHTPGWTGPGSTARNWSDSNIPFGAGIIRLRDTRSRTAATWGHALMVDYSGNCADGQAHPRYVYPATSGDGRATGAACAPMGARWQLDPAINCNTSPSMVGKPRWLKQMCRTLQVYGAITGHSATGKGNGDGIWTEWYGNLGSARYPWANPATGAWPDYYSPTMDLPPDLLFHFRVIDWTKWKGTATPAPKGRKHRKPASR